MVKVQYVLMGISVLSIGLFVTFYSKRLAHVMVESTKLLNQQFGIKRTIGRGYELCVQLILIVFGIPIILTAIRVFWESVKN